MTSAIDKAVAKASRVKLLEAEAELQRQSLKAHLDNFREPALAPPIDLGLPGLLLKRALVKRSPLFMYAWLIGRAWRAFSRIKAARTPRAPLPGRVPVRPALTPVRPRAVSRRGTS